MPNSSISDNTESGITIKKIAIIPYCAAGKNMVYSELRSEYPFSFEFVLSCYKQLCDKKEYPITAFGYSKKNAAEILFTFIKLYESIQFSNPLLMKYGFQHVLPIDFSNYDIKSPVNEDMKEIIIKILQRTDNNGCKDEDLIKSFIELFDSEYANNFSDSEKITENAIEEYRKYINEVRTKHESIVEPERIIMKRIPKFVGAEIQHSEYSKIYMMISSGLEIIRGKFFPNKNSDVDSIISSIKDESIWKDNHNWRVPSFWHVTSYYIGKKDSAPDSEFLKKFEVGINLDIDCEILLYVPKRLVMGILYCPSLTLHSSYKVPSVVWLLNKGNMILGREICEQLFENNQEMYKKYSEGGFRDDKEYCEVEKIEVGKEQKVCYVVKLIPKTTIKAATKFFYS